MPHAIPLIECAHNVGPDPIILGPDHLAGDSPARARVAVPHRGGEEEDGRGRAGPSDRVEPLQLSLGRRGRRLHRRGRRLHRRGGRGGRGDGIE